MTRPLTEEELEGLRQHGGGGWCTDALEVTVGQLLDTVDAIKAERDKLAAALELLWEADRGTREAYIDDPDEELTPGAIRLRDAWRALRDAR